MKKIISLIASLSLLVASMAVAPVASAAEAPTLEIDATRITDFTDYAKYDYGEGYAAYLVTFNVTGLELETVLGTGMAKTKSSGTSLSSYTVQYTAEVNGDKDDAWVFDTLSALGDKTLDTWNGKMHTFSYGGATSMIYPAAGTAATIAKTDKIPVYKAILVMAEGETFKMTVNKTGCKINVSEFEKNAFVADSDTESVLAVSDVTIPMAEGGEGDDNEDDDTATAMVAGVDTITAEGRHYGKSSIATPEAVLAQGLVKIVVTNSNSEEVQTWEAPATLGDGKSSVLGIITYNKADWLGSIFTMNFLGDNETLIKAFTYEVK